MEVTFLLLVDCRRPDTYRDLIVLQLIQLENSLCLLDYGYLINLVCIWILVLFWSFPCGIIALFVKLVKNLPYHATTKSVLRLRTSALKHLAVDKDNEL